MRRSTRLRLAAVSIAVLALAGGVLAGCGDDDSDAGASTAPKELTKVTFALDWTPNTNHTGIYVAQKLGYYAAAGIDLRSCPTPAPRPRRSSATARPTSASPTRPASLRAGAGEDVTSVFAVLQHTALEIGLRADRTDITTPKDLDGKTYAGFGTPDEKPLLETVIRHAGGKGEFKDVTLNTSAYDAVYRGKADFTLPLATWEGIQAARGQAAEDVQARRYGVPPEYSSLIASSREYLGAHPEVSKAFVEATQKGYEYAAEHPNEASDL